MIERPTASLKFSMRATPQFHNRLAMLSTKLGRSMANTVCWLVEQASKDLPEQNVLIVKPKRKRSKSL